MKNIELQLYAPFNRLCSEKEPSDRDIEIWRAFKGMPIYAIVRSTGIKTREVISSCRRAAWWFSTGYEKEKRNDNAIMQLRVYREGNKKNPGVNRIRINDDDPSAIYRNSHELTRVINKIRRLAL